MSTGTGNLPNPSMSFTPFDILTADEMNDLVDNIEALATGTGIGDGAIGTSDLANGAVTSSKVDFTTSTDANGWALLDHGHYKEYFKKISVSKSFGAGGFGDETITTNLPVGVSTLGTGYLFGSLRAASDPQQLTLGFKAISTSTSIILAIKNNYTGSISYTGDIVVRLAYLT